jgi:hypothetical protein
VIHYHGGPITPETAALRAWTRRHAFISYASPSQIRLAASICQSFALDNGAFSAWKAGRPTDWPGYYTWCDEWLRHPACDWAVIPDVIGGSEDENDELISEWPHGHKGVPVWHLNESPRRLVRLAAEWPRIALGSAAEWDVSKPRKCIERLAQTLPAISDSKGRPTVKLHGLRMLNPVVVERVPLASGDSTNIARNIGIDSAWRGTYSPATKEARADVIADRIERAVSPPTLVEYAAADPALF